MTEAFLHYLFNQRKLGKTFQTTEGDVLDIIDFGKLNENAGPDFLEAKIKLRGVTWAGHIEFHLKSSDWIKHRHQKDAAYNNVIAHFVYEHDKEIYSGDFLLPVVELKGLIQKTEVYKYETFVKSKHWIPCESQIDKVDQIVWSRQKSIVSEVRLKRKANEARELLDKNRGDQKRTLMILMAQSIGGKVNKSAFETLANKLEVRYLAHLNFSPKKIQALLHGLSGLLPQISNESYVNDLKSEFAYQQKLFTLKPMSPAEWKFSSMRPAGSPPIRIAQFAALISNQENFNIVQKNENFKERLMISLDPFWNTHYNFANQTKTKSVQLGDSINNSLIINAFIPFLLMVSSNDFELEGVKNAQDLLKSMSPENNAVVKKWQKLGMPINSAYDSQALLEQKNELCKQKKCLFCSVGKHLLNL